MCRSIKTLRSTDAVVTDPEIRAAALQYVRKISGFRQPSNANTAVFEAAVDQIALASKQLLEGLARPKTASRRVTSKVSAKAS
jgi:hypothetical protein